MPGHMPQREGTTTEALATVRYAVAERDKARTSPELISNHEGVHGFVFDYSEESLSKKLFEVPAPRKVQAVHCYGNGPSGAVSVSDAPFNRAVLFLYHSADFGGIICAGTKYKIKTKRRQRVGQQ